MRILLLAVVWLVLTDGDPSGWLFGVVLVPLVALVWHRLFPVSEHRIRLSRVPLFLVWFGRQSLVAGLDVARRLLTPGLPVQPGFRSFRLQFARGGPRWLLANCLSLLPGTLSVTLDGDRLELHCLDTGADVHGDVHTAALRVAGLFGLPAAEVGVRPAAAGPGAP